MEAPRFYGKGYLCLGLDFAKGENRDYRPKLKETVKR